LFLLNGNIILLPICYRIT